MNAPNHLPKLLQIEPTTACNFNCEMCLHDSTAKSHDQFLDMETYRRLADEVFPTLNGLILFGWGEPLMHPDFLEMLTIARATLPDSSTIKVTSNGSLFNELIIDTFLENHLIDYLNVSCDKPPGDTSDFPGHHSASDLVLNNLDYMLQHPLRSRTHISIETVIMQSNIAALPELVEQFGRRGIDSIFVSHVFPYHARLEGEMLYSLMSAEALTVFEQLGEFDPAAWFGLQQQTHDTAAVPQNLTPRQHLLLKQARQDDIKLNYALFQKIKPRLREFEHTRAVFEHARSIAEHHGMLLDLPPLFGVLKQRTCPYIQADAAVIRADGAVVPCFKNLYAHSAYFNGRTRAYTPHVFDSIAQTPFAKIWNATDYRQFRADMQDMNGNIAWCGDCSFSLFYCYFSEEARHDCMLNTPFCADCPFSLNLTRCYV
jgi:MoaA/NifB/PqqE/SkfB family radical SAM enzyme